MNKQVYVALLRGINVGGKAKVEMSRLKELCESIGLEQTKTYINSGNVIFVSNKTSERVSKILEEAIEKEFDLNVPVVILTLQQLQMLLEKVPNEWANDATQKTDVMFLWPEIDEPSIVEQVSVKPEIERVIYVPGALVWNIGRKDVTRGSGIKLIKSDIYKHITVRNINTVRNLCSLMQEIKK